MSKREAKKQHLIDCGLEVMKSQGYNATGVKDIVDAAGVPKGSFYNYFESKEQFALEVIDKVANAQFESINGLLRGSELSAKTRLKSFFEANIATCCDNNFKVGCFLGNMCQEMAEHSELIRRKIELALADVTRVIEVVLRQAQSEGELDGRYDAAALAEFLLNSWQGALMRMKATSSKDPLTTFCFHLETLFFTPSALAS